MRVRVSFAFNPKTGQVEEFLIADISQGAQGEDHEENHDRIAEDYGATIDRLPSISQVQPGSPGQGIADLLRTIPGYEEIEDSARRQGQAE